METNEAEVLKIPQEIERKFLVAVMPKNQEQYPYEEVDRGIWR